SDFDTYKQWFIENCVNTDFIQIDLTKKTACAYMLTDNSNNQLTIFAVGAMQDISALTNFDFDGLPKIDYAVISPGFPYSMLYLAQSCMERKIPYLVDPGQSLTALSTDALFSLIDSSEGFIANEYEAQLISKTPSMPIRKFAKRTSFLIVTKGEKGADIYVADKITHVPAVKDANVVEVTGCGDAFRSGFLHGLTNNESLEKSCQLGHITASFAIEQKGTQKHRFTLEDFRQRFRKYYG
ncbi:MAG: PfkB family carbohydrate kinase, partial [Candidatus Gracilibacteria bacterium]